MPSYFYTHPIILVPPLYCLCLSPNRMYVCLLLLTVFFCKQLFSSMYIYIYLYVKKKSEVLYSPSHWVKVKFVKILNAYKYTSAFNLV